MSRNIHHCVDIVFSTINVLGEKMVEICKCCKKKWKNKYSLSNHLRWKNKKYRKKVSKSISKSCMGRKPWCYGITGEEFLKHYKKGKVWGKNKTLKNSSIRRLAEQKRKQSRDYSDITGNKNHMKTLQSKQNVSIKIKEWHKKNKNTIEYKNRNKKISVKLKEDLKTRYIRHPEWHPNRKLASKNVRTWIEKIMAENLKKNNIDYEEQKRILRYYADFFIKPNIVVECDGEAWHNEKTKEYDEKRQKRIESCGYRVIRFKGKEINKNIDSCILKIKKFIKKGDKNA